MASRNFLSAFLILITTTVAMYIFYVTFGGAMDALYYNFSNLTPTLSLPTAWNTQAEKTLTYWRLFYTAGIGIVIATGMWVVRITFMDQSYERQY